MPRDAASILTDDPAVFVEDTMDALAAARIGASPSGIAVLSPARRPGCATAAARGRPASTPGGSAAKPPVRVFADQTNTPSVAFKKRLFDLHLPAPTTAGGGTPLRAVQWVRGVPAARPALAVPHVSHVATSPLPCTDRAEDLRAENERLTRMYEFMSERAEATERQRADAQAKLDEKITEVIALSSRLEETKRFTKQLKAELRESKVRSLPLFNAALADPGRLAQTYKEKLAAVEEEYHMQIDQQQETIESLEEALDSVGISTNHAEALLVALRQRREAERLVP